MVIEFHNFKEAVECIEEGGAAYIYADPSIYFKENGIITSRYQIKTSSYDSGANAYYGYIVSNSMFGYFGNTVTFPSYTQPQTQPQMFDLHKQQSVSWILISPDDWKKQEAERIQKDKEERIIQEAKWHDWNQREWNQRVTEANNRIQQVTLKNHGTKFYEEFIDWFKPIYEEFKNARIRW